jgi:predicted exporter
MERKTKLNRFFMRLLIASSRHRLILYAIVIILFLLSMYGIFHGQYSNNIAKMLPDSSESARTLEIMGRNGLSSRGVISFDTGGKAFSDSALPDYLEKLGARLKSSPMIMRVDYQFIPKSLTSSLDNLSLYLPQLIDAGDFERLASDDGIATTVKQAYRQLFMLGGFGTTERLRMDPFNLRLQLLEKLNDFQKLSGIQVSPLHSYIVSLDERKALLLFESKISAADTVGSRRLLTMLRESLRDCPSGITFDIISPNQHAVDNEEIIKADVKTVAFTSFIVFTLLFIIFYHCDFRSLLIPAMPTLASVIVMAGMPFVFKECLFFVLGMGGLIIGLAVGDYGTHVYAASSGSFGLRRVARLFLPLLVTCLTTVGAFLLFLISDIEAFRQIGFYAGVSLLLSLLLTVFLLTPLFSNKNRRPYHVAIPRFPIHRPMLVISVWAVMLILAIPALTKIKFNADIQQFDMTSQMTLKAETRYEKDWQSGIRPAMLIVTGKSKDAVLQRGETLAAQLRRVLPGINCFSPTDISPSAGKSSERLLQWRRLEESGHLLQISEETRRKAVEQGFAPEFFNPFFNALSSGIKQAPVIAPELFLPLLSRTIISNGEWHSMMIFYPDLDYSNVKARSLVAEDPDCAVISQNAFQQLISSEVSGRFIFLLALAVALTCIVTFLFFRSFLLTSVALVPTVCSLLFTGAAYAAFNIPINISVCFGCIILAGVSIDYGIFMVHAHLRHEEPAIADAIALSAITLISGGATVVFTQHPMLRYAGYTVISGVVFAWLSAVVVIPALLKFIAGRRALILPFALLLMIFTGCRSEPFAWPEFPPLAPVISKEVMLKKWSSEQPAEFIVEAGIVFEYRGHAMTSLCMTRVNISGRSIDVVGMNPAGAKIFEASGIEGKTISFSALPILPEMDTPKAGDTILRDIGNIYFDLVPTANSIPGKPAGNRLPLMENMTVNSHVQYLFAGNPLRLIRKIFYCDNNIEWQVSYFEYLGADGKIIPKNIVYDNFKYGYRLIVRTRTAIPVKNEGSRK